MLGGGAHRQQHILKLEVAVDDLWLSGVHVGERIGDLDAPPQCVGERVEALVWKCELLHDERLEGATCDKLLDQEHSLLAAARRGLLLADADVRDDVAVLELPHQRDLCKEALNVLRVPQDLWLEAFDRDNLHGAARQRLVLALVHDCKRALTKPAYRFELRRGDAINLVLIAQRGERVGQRRRRGHLLAGRPPQHLAAAWPRFWAVGQLQAWFCGR
mmetsp:Transcript_13051/g.37914  ORF Transcript_13051/g.37914 Transcript_13051/m.37914 type:complete len:217 (+) Transcript_13051:2221-2871(+)